MQAWPAFRERAQAVEPHRIKPLENVAVFAMLRRATVLLGEALDFLEAGDDALLVRRASALLLGLGKLGELRSEFVEIEVTHSGPPP